MDNYYNSLAREQMMKAQTALAKMRSITVETQDGIIVTLNYPHLNLVYQNGQLCFYYESSDGDLIMPIARGTTIDSLKGGD